MKKPHIQLQEEERKNLENLLSKGNSKVRVQKRALSLLELDRGKKYQSEGLIFLNDKPRTGRPVGLSGEQKPK